MLDDKNAQSKSIIPKNDEPTRFLTKEEMEQLEQGTFQQFKSDAENVQKKSANIKIEELPPKEAIQP